METDRSGNGGGVGVWWGGDGVGWGGGGGVCCNERVAFCVCLFQTNIRPKLV